MSAEVQRCLDAGHRAESSGQTREALEHYAAAAELAVGDVESRRRLGILRYRMRDYAGSRQVLQQALTLEPDDAELEFWLGRACEALGDRPAATAAYGRTMMLAPSSWQTWYLIGRDHRRLGHGEVARLAYLRALDQAPDEPELLAALGSLLRELEMRDDAYPLLANAVRRCPNDPGYLLQLGLAELDRGDLPAAQRALTAAKHLDPSDRRIDVALQGLAIRKLDERRQRKAA